jgi:hypothetical protein
MFNFKCQNNHELSDQVSSFTHITDARWSVEVYHREIKQTCGIERCQSRTGRAQRNHIFMAIAAWFEQHKLRIKHKTTLYQQNWNVVKRAIQEQIKILMFQAA